MPLGHTISPLCVRYAGRMVASSAAGASIVQKSGTPQLGLLAPEPTAVRGQLARILTSTDFNAPQRIRSFLTFVIEEALAGRGDRIKAFSIATHVFGRGEDFDALNDPVVRIEAGRLRRALERYYLLSGRDDPVVIDIPRGTYAPSIRLISAPVLAGAEAVAKAQPEGLPKGVIRLTGSRWRPHTLIPALAAAVVLILAVAGALFGFRTDRTRMAPTPEVVLTVTPFANLSGPDGALYAAGLSDELLSQLARFRELRVISRDAMPPRQRPDASAGAQYVLEGGVRAAGQQLRVSARLLEGRSSRIIWNGVYDRDLTTSGSFAIESDIAAKVAMAVAQPYGVIFTPVSSDASSQSPDSAEAYDCTLRFYQYRKILDQEEHALTRQCLERTTARFPNYSTGWAMLAYLYLDEERFDLNRRPNGSAGRFRARDAAERAISLDPDNVRGHQALMTVLFFSREPEAALRIGEKALALNPNDSEMLAELGARIAQAGDWRRGTAMLEDAQSRNPGQTSYHVGLIALGHYMQGDDKKALEWIRRVDLKRFALYHLVASLIFARSGLDGEAKARAAEFMRMRPRFFDDLDAELSMRNFNARDRAILIAGARQAGFPVGAGAQ